MAEKDKNEGAGEPSEKRKVTDEISKSLKEAGQKAAELAQNPVARNMFAAGLVTAAAALTANKKFRNKVEDAGKTTQRKAEQTVENAGAIGTAIITAATDAVRRLLSLGEAEEAATPAAPAAQAKKPAPRKKAAAPRAAKATAATKKPATSRSSAAGTSKARSAATTAPKANGAAPAVAVKSAKSPDDKPATRRASAGRTSTGKSPARSRAKSPAKSEGN